MSYSRVIPRDLFNEADLLKCYGALWIALERHPRATLEQEDDGPFQVVQGLSGELTLRNVRLFVQGDAAFEIYRPLNSREPWPLWLTDGNDVDLRVFTEEGKLSAEFKALVA